MEGGFSVVQKFFVEQLHITYDNLWIVQVFLVVFLTLLANLIARRMMRTLEGKLASTENLWDDALLSSLSLPLGWLIWVVGIAWAAEIASIETHLSLLNFIEPLRRLLVVVLIVWFLVRFISHLENNLLISKDKKRIPDATTVHAVSKLMRVSVFITAALVILQSFGYSISGVLAFGGIGGIAVGFAAKDVLSNFFGALMLYLDRPFQVGDWVRSPDREIEGTVEEVSWRLTRIRTFDSRPLYVPNAVFATISLENPSRMKNRRIYETIGVRYEDQGKLKSILEKVNQMIREHSAIDQKRTIMVNFNKFAPSSLDFFIYCFTITTNWATYHGIKEEILLTIQTIILEAGAQVAYPTSTIHVAALPDPEPTEPV